MAPLQRVQEIKEGVLVDGLRREGEIAVPILDGSIATARRTERIDERRREQRTADRLAVGPLIRDVVAVMTEVVQIEAERAVGMQGNQLFYLVPATRIAVGGEPHQFVFVAVMREAEILGHGLVEDAERMRKQDTAFERKRRRVAIAPRRAGEIAEAVDGNDRRFAEGRWIKRRRQVSQVMLDVIDRAGERAARQRAQLLDQALDLRPVAQPLQQQMRVRPAGRHVGELAEKIGAATAVDGDVRDVGQVELRLVQTIGNGAGREAGPVLDPAKPLLLGCRHQRAVAHDAGSSVGMVGVDPENDRIRCHG